MLFLVMLFFWYSQVTVAAFNYAASALWYTITHINQWFLLEAKGLTIHAVVGEGLQTAPQLIRLAVS